MRATTSYFALALTAILVSGRGSDGSSMTDPNDSGDALAPGIARVTIGGTTWTATAVACPNFESALGFVGMTDDEPPVSITLDAVPADPPSNSARVDVSDNVSWRAGEAHVSLGATIPVVTAQNGHATGSTTFVNTLDPNGPSSGTYQAASGTYEFTCP